MLDLKIKSQINEVLILTNRDAEPSVQAEFTNVMCVSGQYPTKPWWKFW